MKRIKKNIRYIVLAALLLPVTVFSYTMLSDAPSGILLKAIRSVEYQKAETESWDDATSGLPLATNDKIRTGEKSFAMIKFLDNSRIRVQQNSEVTIYSDRVGNQLKSNTSIESGGVGFEVTEQKEADEFRFTTPTMVASIRGTAGLIEIQDGDNSFIGLTSGSADVRGTGGSQGQGSIGAGQFALVGPDGNVTTGQMSQDQLDDVGNGSQMQTKTLRINTKNNGVIIIEYFDE